MCISIDALLAVWQAWPNQARKATDAINKVVISSPEDNHQNPITVSSCHRRKIMCFKGSINGSLTLFQLVSLKKNA
jgi:hypothetical protein